MTAPDKPNEKALAQLTRLARTRGRDRPVPRYDRPRLLSQRGHSGWYDPLTEAERWEVQARFWSAVARTCRDSRAVFCYDLMNEPVIGGDTKEGWLGGELAGKYFVQRLTLDPGEAIRRGSSQGLAGTDEFSDSRGRSRPSGDGWGDPVGARLADGEADFLLSGSRRAARFREHPPVPQKGRSGQGAHCHGDVRHRQTISH